MFTVSAVIHSQVSEPQTKDLSLYPQQVGLNHYVAEGGFELLGRAEITGMSQCAWLSTGHIYGPASTYSPEQLCTALLCAHSVGERTKAQGAKRLVSSPTTNKWQAYGVRLAHFYLGQGLPGLCPVVTSPPALTPLHLFRSLILFLL